MRKILNILLIALVFNACNKAEDKVSENISDPYQLPWKTKYIHYQNISMCNGNHSSGYKLYYKDSLIKEDCIIYGGISISDSIFINDSILHLFLVGNSGSYDLFTKNGGYRWEQTALGPPEIYKTHTVNPQLLYCVTKNQNDIYFTGIGKSNLAVYKQSLTKGTHYITDSGTSITDIDSTCISLNDTVSYIIKFGSVSVFAKIYK